VGLIDEMESYKRQKNVHDEELEKPVKDNDDLVDCLRYMANDIQKPGLTWK
jgi:3-methyladenine DNA glycosylase Tag